MLKVGLTGGIGSGKTMVAQIFEVLSIPVYYADSAARDLMNKDAELKKKIIASFGADAYKNGELNRSYLGSIVFPGYRKTQSAEFNRSSGNDTGCRKLDEKSKNSLCHKGSGPDI